jgi:hypothetical protein
MFYIDNKTWIGFPLVIIAFFTIGIDVIQLLDEIFIIGAISFEVRFILSKQSLISLGVKEGYFLEREMINS